MFKRYKYGIIAIFFFQTLYITSVFAQYNPLGVPKITNFESKDYGYESQNYDILQSEQGLIYFANTNGIIEYDNHTWNLVPVKGQPDLDIDCFNNIYVGGFNEISILNNTRAGVKLNSIKTEEIDDFGEIKNIVALCGEVFFATDSILLSYKNNSLSKIKTITVDYNIFKIAGTLYLFVQDEGLYQYINGNFEIIDGQQRTISAPPSLPLSMTLPLSITLPLSMTLPLSLILPLPLILL